MDSVRALCLSRGWELDEPASTEFADLDVSGFSVSWKDRPGLSQHFEDAKNGLFSRLLVAAVDRLGRNAADTMNCWDQFEGVGVTLYSIRESLDTSTPTGILIRNIMMSVAEVESRNASARIKANVEKRAKLGRLHGGRLPFWLTRDEQKVIVLRENEAAMIRLAVAMRLAGESYVQITRTINDAGYRTVRTGEPYERSFLVKMLQKPDWIETMMGHAYTRREGRYTTDPRTKRRVSRGTPIKIENAFPPVIDEITGNRLHASHEGSIRVKRDLDGVIRRDRSSQRWMLNGLFQCAECGSRMSTHVRSLPDRERRTYVCEKNNNHPLGDHTRSLVDADIVEMAVVIAIVSYIQRADKEAKEQTEIIKPLAKKRTIVDVDQELSRTVELYAWERIPSDILDAQVQKLADERDRLLRAELLSRATQDKPKPAMTPGMSRQNIRELIKSMGLTISYPVYLEGVTQPENYRTKQKAPKPCVKIEWPDNFDPDSEYDVIWEPPKIMVMPVYRMEYMGLRGEIYVHKWPHYHLEEHTAYPEIVNLAREIIGR